MPEFTTAWISDVDRQQWAAIFQPPRWDRDQPHTIVEIGAFEGRTTLWCLANLLAHPESRIHCIDTFAGGVEHHGSTGFAAETTRLRERFDANIAESGAGEKVVVHQGTSAAMLPRLVTEGIVADFVYVDGSHQAPDVLLDTVLGFSLLRVGGYMICDDYLWYMEAPGEQDVLNSPKIAIDAFVNIYRRKLRIIRNQKLYQLILEKVGD